MVILIQILKNVNFCYLNSNNFCTTIFSKSYCPFFISLVQLSSHCRLTLLIISHLNSVQHGELAEDLVPHLQQVGQVHAYRYRGSV